MLFPFEQKIKLQIQQYAKISDRILVAVSAGSDSMCLLHVLRRLGYNVLVAHVNYQLRYIDSEGDELFVKTWCAQNDIKYFTKKFDTTAIAIELKKGIQEVARELRYEWFVQVCIENKVDYIATGHHMEDQAETVLLNLIRSAGIIGVSGIHPIRNLTIKSTNFSEIKLIRPLLKIHKVEILDYLTQSNIPFREDSSNLKSDYTRNKIRHEILPKLNEIQPKSTDHIAAFADHIQSILPYYNLWVEHFKKEHIIQHSSFLQFRLDHSINPSLIYLLLQNYAFNAQQSKQIHRSLVNKHVGSEFYSSSYKLVIGHELSDLTRIENKEIIEYSIDALPFQISHVEHRITFSTTNSNTLKPDDYVLLDTANLLFPLTLRTWQPGDKMSPLGMKGKQKKIQDILTDRKIVGVLKSQALVLISNGEIVWLWPCCTVSENFKASANTRLALEIKIETILPIE